MLSSPRFCRLAAAWAVAALSLAAAPAALAQTPPAAPAAAASAPASAAPAAAPAATVVVSGPAGQITQEDVEIIVHDLVPPEQQASFWSNPDAVARLARSLYTQRALAAQAEQAGLDKSPQAQEYFKLLREGALTALLMDARAKAAQPDDQALTAYAQSEYRAKPDRFALPEQVRVRHILIAVAKDGSDDAQAKAKAEELLDELHKGADFEKLAMANSADKSSAVRGGDLGFFARGKMVPAFDEAAFGLKKPGDLAGPIKTQFGYHILELVERKPASAKPFEQVLPELKKEIAAKLAAQEKQRLWEAADAPAQTNDANLKALAARHAEGAAQQP
jgi:peptidyl-prolyl cis-trans isomerase C